MEDSGAQDKLLNRQLSKWQAKAHKLINDPYYDAIAEKLSEVQYSILCRITNAKTYRDINVHLWSGGMIQQVLFDIESALKVAKKRK